MANHPVDDIRQHVLTLLCEEFREHSLVIAQSLIQARRSSSVEERRTLMAELLKRIHGIKGWSGNMGLYDLEDLMHAMEVALSRFRSGDRSIGSVLARKILYVLYQAQRFLEKVAADQDLSDRSLSATAAELLQSAKNE